MPGDYFIVILSKGPGKWMIDTVQAYDIAQEARLARPCTPDLDYHDDYTERKMWKLMTVIRSCICEERLQLEGREVGSPPLSAEELLRLPGPLVCPSKAKMYVGFRYQDVNRMLDMGASQGVTFGTEKCDSRLLILWAEPELVQWKKRECIIQMKAIQVAQKKTTGEDRDVYSLATRGNIVQFHKLTIGREVQSSPMFLLTAEGLAAIWPYLRDIIHQAQLKAPRPDYLRAGPNSRLTYYQKERIILRRLYGYEPDGTRRDESSAATDAERVAGKLEISQIGFLSAKRPEDDSDDGESNDEKNLNWEAKEPSPFCSKNHETRATENLWEELPFKSNSAGKPEQKNEQNQEDG
ncbi:hypothetical protein BJX70DRAFT_403080 [Aspergillus crustosus]